MKNCSFIGSLFVLILLVSGCSKENVSPEISNEIDASYKTGPASLKINANAVGGRLYDLETAPNGDILVADATSGIKDMYGNLETVLPNVTSVSTVGNGIMWATTGAMDEMPGIDRGQGLYLVHKNRSRKVINLFEFETQSNPDGQGIESNPYAVAAISANKALVADAAANDLLRIDNKGNVEVLAIFPNELVSTSNIKSLLGCPNPAPPCGLPAMIPAQAVPTSVVIGPDGYYYVGELKGFPAPIGESNIWRISPDASQAMCGSSPDCMKLFDGGFTSIMDLAFDKNGMLYVAELDARSWYALELGSGAGGTIKRCNPQTLQCEVVASGIPMLTAITFDKKGRLWATRNALIPGMAQVVEIPL